MIGLVNLQQSDQSVRLRLFDGIADTLERLDITRKSDTGVAVFTGDRNPSSQKRRYLVSSETNGGHGTLFF